MTNVHSSNLPPATAPRAAEYSNKPLLLGNKGSVTSDDLFNALDRAINEGETDLIQQWIKDGSMNESTFRYVKLGTEDSVLHYLAKHCKDGPFMDTAIALINLIPQSEIDRPDAGRLTPLLLVSKDPTGKGRLMQALLERGANPNVADTEGCTVLTNYVKHSDDTEGLRYLCYHGVYINAMDDDGHTALAHAIEQAKHDQIPVLIAAGADKSAVSHFGGQSAADFLEVCVKGARQDLSYADGFEEHARSVDDYANALDRGEDPAPPPKLKAYWDQLDGADKARAWAQGTREEAAVMHNRGTAYLEGSEKIKHSLDTSRPDLLAFLGRLFGEAFCADLLRASTMSWEEIKNSLLYAMGVSSTAVENQTLQKADGSDIPQQ